ncbi:MAG: TIGR01777 family oxidoreductase, partial [Actinomycetota bacterium]
MKIVITGSSGLIGTALVRDLESAGHQVVRLVRRPAQSASELQWDPYAARGGLSAEALNGTGGAVNLAGAPVAAGRWTAARKQEIQDSRLASTRCLTELLTGLADPPEVLLSGSAIGFYGDTGGHEVDEAAPQGSGFLAGVTRQWEAAAAPAAAAGIRVVNLRTGIVLSRRGGVLGKLLPVFRLGLGARIGSGKQYMSWITLSDWVRIARYLLGEPAMSGPVNLTAPRPATNAEFTEALASVAGHRAR